MRDQQRPDLDPLTASRHTRHSTFKADRTSARASHASGRRAMVAEYEFLVGRFIDRETLVRAIDIAHRWGVPTYEALMALGWVERESYVAALARHLRMPALAGRGASFPAHVPVVLVDGTAGPPNEVARRVAARQAEGRAVVLASSDVVAQFAGPASAESQSERAVKSLLRKRPQLSAGSPTWQWQVLACVIAFGLALGGATVAPMATSDAVLVVLALAFFPVVLLRARILVGLLSGRDNERARQHPRIPDAELPIYSILVPLLREAAILPDLIRALSNFDYPPGKLDVILVLESTDVETQRAVTRVKLPDFMRVVIVPDSLPRTKPKALNYALPLARGDYVVVYDAEDVPEPDQLRRALALFRGNRERVVCVQARLNVYNPRACWLARQFALEYSALFDVTLPALVKMGLPVPLGGTSNHFPRRVLQQCGGWDPYNVTEDADLGIRLARWGGRTAVLRATTWEEAPVRFAVWLRQRTRWHKGWMQTYFVHTRQPVRLLRELGPLGFLGFHSYSGGLILSGLVFPVFCAMLAFEVYGGALLSVPATVSGQALWLLAGFNLIASYACAIATAAVAVTRRRRSWLMFDTLLMPFYWLLTSLAAYRALFQFVVAPYHWEKTDHRPRGPRKPRER
ncbi:MAG TPA: glycosyltransferase [Hyphomicrobiaceae bacterium]|nr:glycosyltransferase [Hyphomicrobiaceae bacterium]